MVAAAREGSCKPLCVLCAAFVISVKQAPWSCSPSSPPAHREKRRKKKPPEAAHPGAHVSAKARSANAENPQTLIAMGRLAVRERDTQPAATRKAIVIAGGAGSMREQIRCRVVHALGKIRRRHFDIPVGEIAGLATGRTLPATPFRNVAHPIESLYPFRGVGG